ncbi:MAG TPA: hypothetical protein VML19_23510 [Verrucomicrobiae bacterium]|nr:hypothetical protein [Verrucomicrobiae bacterium]
MSRISQKLCRLALPGLMFAAISTLALAQDQPPAPPVPTPPPQTNTWRHMNDQPPAQAQTQTTPAQNPEPVDRSASQANPNPPAQGQQSAPPAYGVPPQLTIKANTYVNIRINQVLNSDKNHVGDTFTATLMQPILADGIVVAPRGQNVYGRVTEAEKAHDGKDSRLGLEMSSVMVADGSQAMLTAHLVAIAGGSMPARVSNGNATRVNTGAAGSAPGVLLTHSHATVVDPGYTLTFALTAPVTINTASAPQAYHYVGPEDYYQQSTRPAQRTGVAPPPYPYYYPYGYPYPYWGPTIGVGFGWGFGWGPRFGFGRRW